MMQLRRIATATLLCLVMSLALFTTGAFARSAHTSVSAKASVAQTVVLKDSVAESIWGFGGFRRFGFGFPFFDFDDFFGCCCFF